ncbi:procathepsin L-like [Scyliorhinus canicula]|uniref:procathepsin L-like n=1 Tax=Scyliorhinus canicula TaxID=7830 RepID=UPI0018F68293|nr:procathepsin L-like [Scyliorhinus canicula]
MEHSIFVMCILAVLSIALANPIFQDFSQLKAVENANKVLQLVDQEVLSNHKLGQQSSLPQKIDWREKGYVTNVKDQGQCASCWAFASAATMEGQLFNKTNNLITLSEQNLLDCAKSYNDKGCAGGWMSHAFKYIRDNGIEADGTYPYTATKQECSFNEANSVGTLQNYVKLTKTTEEEILKAVANHGPVGVYVYMSSLFMGYKSGIFEDDSCTETPNHAVTVVGYVNTPQDQYWIIKNSFSKSWGEDGYMRMKMNKNVCGITYRLYYPIV